MTAQKDENNEKACIEIPTFKCKRWQLGLIILFSIYLTLYTHYLLTTWPAPKIRKLSSEFINLQEKWDVPVQQHCKIPQLKVYTAEIEYVLSEPYDYEHNCALTTPKLFETDLENNLISLGNPKDHGFDNCCYSKMTLKEGEGVKMK